MATGRGECCPKRAAGAPCLGGQIILSSILNTDAARCSRKRLVPVRVPRFVSFAEMNTVQELLRNPFKSRSYAEKLQIKQLGPDRPDLELKQTVSKGKGKTAERKFNNEWYKKKQWLIGCRESNSLFCFCCLLYGGDETWSKKGMRDIKHLSERIKSHECSRAHINNATELALLGKVNIGVQLDTAYQQHIKRHNAQVDRNRYVLSKIIDCVKFCGAFELALRGHDETKDSAKKGIFLGLIDFSAELDTVLREHLQKATIFKGTSKTVQNEILDCMLSVCREDILREINESNFLAIQADETTDCSTATQLVLIYRYVLPNGQVIERFFGFFKPTNACAPALAQVILDELRVALGDEKQKLIAQTYDGAAVMSGKHRGVFTIIQEQFPYAYYIHCYAHQLNLTMLQASSSISQVRLFFMNLSGFPSFFSKSSQRTKVLDSVMAKRRIPKTSSTRWNFNSRLVQTVYENKEELTECFRQISTSGEFNAISVREATGLLALLETNESFLYWLRLFFKIMPNVDTLYAQLQKRETDPLQVSANIDQFQKAISMIRNNLDVETDYCDAESSSSFKSARVKSGSDRGSTHIVLAKEVCDIVTVQVKERFSFSGHLLSSKLFNKQQYASYSKKFPEAILTSVIEAYPFLNENKLRTELGTVYSRHDFHSFEGAVSLLKFIIDNNLEDVYSETSSLLKILVTTPMTSAEAERCFSTLKRIKTFLRSTMTEERLNALAMISIEKKLCETKDFNKRVIEKFASIKERRLDFFYK